MSLVEPNAQCVHTVLLPTDPNDCSSVACMNLLSAKAQKEVVLV